MRNIYFIKNFKKLMQQLGPQNAFLLIAAASQNNIILKDLELLPETDSDLKEITINEVNYKKGYLGNTNIQIPVWIEERPYESISK